MIYNVSSVTLSLYVLMVRIAAPEINYSLEQYGASSVCFDHGSAWTVQHCYRTYPVEHWGSGCYQVVTGTTSYYLSACSLSA